MGAKQFVVQLAIEMILCDFFNLFSFTPKTIVTSGFIAGEEINTFFAPALRCLDALSLSLNLPVASRTTSILSSFQGKFSGSLSEKTLIVFPPTLILLLV